MSRGDGKLQHLACHFCTVQGSNVCQYMLWVRLCKYLLEDRICRACWRGISDRVRVPEYVLYVSRYKNICWVPVLPAKSTSLAFLEVPSSSRT